MAGVKGCTQASSSTEGVPTADPSWLSSCRNIIKLFLETTLSPASVTLSFSCLKTPWETSVA